MTWADHTHTHTHTHTVRWVLSIHSTTTLNSEWELVTSLNCQLYSLCRTMRPSFIDNQRVSLCLPRSHILGIIYTNDNLFHSWTEIIQTCDTFLCQILIWKRVSSSLYKRQLLTTSIVLTWNEDHLAGRAWCRICHSVAAVTHDRQTTALWKSVSM